MGKEQTSNSRYTGQTQATALATATDSPDLKKLIYGEILAGAQPVAEEMNIQNLQAVNEGSLGDLPWYHHSGTNTNVKTYDWVNKVFAYNPAGYVETDGEDFTSSYFNVLLDTAYVLNTADEAAINNVLNENATVVNTLITDFATTQGPIPAANNNQSSQLAYIISKILTWGATELTVQQLYQSLDPSTLLTNVPFGADQIVTDFVTYLGIASSILGIQDAVASNNKQLEQTRSNIQPAPLALKAGWIETIDDAGNLAIEPEIDFAESTSNIQNELFPDTGTGRTFSVNFTAASTGSNQVSVNSSSGSGIGDLGFFFGVSDSSGSSYNMFSFAENLESCTVAMDFVGVTKLTPAAAAYDISNASGWWNAEPIRDAVNAKPDQSGYKFATAPQHNFGTNGDFGFLSTIMISQQPTLTLTYEKASLSQFQQVFEQSSSWGVSFLGISLGGGSESSYLGTTSQTADGNGVVVTMAPVKNGSHVSTLDQLAYVVGAEVLWMGASS